MLFADSAPSLRILLLRDCHYLQHQNLFPSLVQFSSTNSANVLEDQTEFHCRRSAIHVLKSLSTSPQLKHLTLRHVIYNPIDKNFDAKLAEIGTVELPVLESLRFYGDVADAQRLLDVLKIGPKCSKSFHLSFRDLTWHTTPPRKLVSTINLFLDQIPKDTSFDTLALHDSDGNPACLLEHVYFQLGSQTGSFYELKISEQGLFMEAKKLTTDERWSLHPRRLSTRGPSVGLMDIVFSAILKRISSSDNLLPPAYRTLQLSVNGVFHIQQVLDVFLQMDGITHIAFRSWDAICNPVFLPASAQGAPLYFPNLTSISFDHHTLTTTRTISALIKYLSSRLVLFGAMPEVVVLTHATPSEEMKRSLESRLENAKEWFLDHLNERELEGADITMHWRLT